jgi:hypothetical protein
MAEHFIEHIDTYGRFRYLEVPYHTSGCALIELDRAVWEVRRYCQTLDFSRIMDPSKGAKWSEIELGLIEAAENRAPNSFSLHGGFLERVIQEKKHPARRALTWKNFYFGLRVRNRMSVSPVYMSVNSPLSLNPELLDDMLKYVKLPDPVKAAYLERLKNASGDEAKP